MSSCSFFLALESFDTFQTFFYNFFKYFNVPFLVLLHFKTADGNFYACLSRNGYDGTAGRQQLVCCCCCRHSRAYCFNSMHEFVALKEWSLLC